MMSGRAGAAREWAMTMECRSVEVSLRYSNRTHEYRWEAEYGDDLLTGWETVLGSLAADGWVLVSSCVDSYQENNTTMEATAYRLFLTRQTH
jgi:hypothetical protein